MGIFFFKILGLFNFQPKLSSLMTKISQFVSKNGKKILLKIFKPQKTWKTTQNKNYMTSNLKKKKFPPNF